MKSIDRISKFRPELINAFDKMIRGVNIELTKDFREERIKNLETNGMDKNLSRWWFIQSINEDETLNLCSTNHFIIGRVKISECIL